MTTALAHHAACRGCLRAETRSRTTHAWETCRDCGAELHADATAAPPPPKPRRPAGNPELALLRDAAAIAKRQGKDRPRALAPPEPGGRRPPSSDPPDWILERAREMSEAADLSDRLELLEAAGRSDDRLLALAWVLATVARAALAVGSGVDDRGRIVCTPPRADLSVGDALALAAAVDATRPGPSERSRAGAVMRWLVTHARPILDSAGSQGRPGERELPLLLAEAFTTDEQWQAWHPRQPAPPVPAADPGPSPGEYVPTPPPEPPAPLSDRPSDWERAQHAVLCERHRGDVRVWLAREPVREAQHARDVCLHLEAVARFANREQHHAEAERRHAAAVKRQRLATEAGDLAARSFGRGLLDLTLRVWQSG